MMLTHRVQTPLGICEVSLERSGLDLSERGGFSARWLEAGSDTDTEILTLEAYRAVVKAYLAELYRQRHGREPGGVTLNLASHQLLDDVIGWTKLNWQPNLAR